MKINNSINALFLAFCLLLLGFVYFNTRFTDGFELKRSTHTPTAPADTEVGNPDKHKIIE